MSLGHLICTPLQSRSLRETGEGNTPPPPSLSFSSADSPRVRPAAFPGSPCLLGVGSCGLGPGPEYRTLVHHLAARAKP